MSCDKAPCCYILASQPRGTLYVGVTSDLFARLYQHRNGVTRGFTSRYAVYRLARFELADTMEQAILREKQIKRWHRPWKINLIERDNSHWLDLAIGLGFDALPLDNRHAILVSASIADSRRTLPKNTPRSKAMDPETSSG